MTTKELVMDRALRSIEKTCNGFEIFLQQMAIDKRKGTISEELYEDGLRLHERLVDDLTLAKNWRLLAEMNGVKLDEVNDEN